MIWRCPVSFCTWLCWDTFAVSTCLDASICSTRSDSETWDDPAFDVAPETPPFLHGLWRPGGMPTTPPGPPPATPFTPRYPPPRHSGGRELYALYSEWTLLYTTANHTPHHKARDLYTLYSAYTLYTMYTMYTMYTRYIINKKDHIHHIHHIHHIITIHIIYTIYTILYLYTICTFPYRLFTIAGGGTQGHWVIYIYIYIHVFTSLCILSKRFTRHP